MEKKKKRPNHVIYIIKKENFVMICNALEDKLGENHNMPEQCT